MLFKFGNVVRPPCVNELARGRVALGLARTFLLILGDHLDGPNNTAYRGTSLGTPVSFPRLVARIARGAL